jgi:hypothetical protein
VVYAWLSILRLRSEADLFDFSERPPAAWCLYKQEIAVNKGPGR